MRRQAGSSRGSNKRVCPTVRYPKPVRKHQHAIAWRDYALIELLNNTATPPPLSLSAFAHNKYTRLLHVLNGKTEEKWILFANTETLRTRCVFTNFECACCMPHLSRDRVASLRPCPASCTKQKKKQVNIIHNFRSIQQRSTSQQKQRQTRRATESRPCWLCWSRLLKTEIPSCISSCGWNTLHTGMQKRVC